MSIVPPIQEIALRTDRAPRSLDSVLVAEDDPLFRQALSSWLKKWNYSVIAVENGLDAWTILREDDAPRMALLDWMMPGVDGVELCRRIRAHESGLYRYVLLLTARDGKQDVITGLDAGADDYLTKPFDIDELRARIRAGERILQLQDALLRAQGDLRFEASHDSLTGVWNRRAILDLLMREFHRHERTRQPLGVMMTDLDHFKNINDTFGHLAGDSVLQESVRRLTASVRNYDLVGRYGGEEFLIVLPGCSPPQLAATAERLRDALASSPAQTGAGPIALSISVGIVSTFAEKQPRFNGYEAMISAADEALYAAKAKGRNRVESVTIPGEAVQPR